MSDGADDSAFRTGVDRALDEFVARQRLVLAELGPALEPLLDAALAYVGGGKRLRPLFCRAGWLIAGGNPDEPALPVAASAFEWLQASALAHDDVMDGSDTRRGKPSLHRAFEATHRDEQRVGDAAAFGRSVAILAGDLMLSWADEVLSTAALHSVEMKADFVRARTFWDQCKSEVVSGQFLDVVGQTRASVSVDEAMLIVRNKSARYTVERPLHVGAALAGADDALIAALSDVALPLGEAFQLRDDVLGVFGDPHHTGKPAGDDLREGKRTVLIARTLDRCDDAGREVIATQLGTSAGVDAVRAVIERSGALAVVEQDIAELEARAASAAEAIGPDAAAILSPLAATAVRRTR